MPTQFFHRTDHAVAQFTGDLTFAPAQLAPFEPDAPSLAPLDTSVALGEAPGDDGPSGRPGRKRRRSWSVRSRSRRIRRNGHASATSPESRP